MSRYNDLLANRNRDGSLSDLHPLTDIQINNLLRQYPNVPVDFLDFLQVIGTGTIGPDRYSIYDGLVDAKEILGETAVLDSMMLFGDDFAGISYGYDLCDWRIVEIDSSLGTARKVDLSFEVFVRDLIDYLE